jgi:predicted transcriptional regulator
MSSERKYTGMAKLFAIEEKQQKEKAAEKSAINTSSPTISRTEEQSTAVESTAVGFTTAESTVVKPTVVNKTVEVGKILTVERATAVKPSLVTSQWTLVINDFFDEVLPTLKPTEAIVLTRLLRLSRGYHSDTCKVGSERLSKHCNISKKQAQISLNKLISAGWIERVDVDQSGASKIERGSVYRVLIPAATVEKITAVKSTTVNTTAVRNSSNKVNTQKENTQTQDAPPATVAPGVRVGSKFTIEECRRYAKHLQSTGQGINNPGGYATTIHRTGEADLLIENFLNPIAPTQPSDISQCPDCHGAGMYYPEGLGKGGVKKCTHEKLKRAEAARE